MYSDNIYFAQTALAIGEKDLIAGFKKLGVGEKLSYEYPIRGSQISNSGKLENSKLLADTGYGQGEVLMSMLHLSTLFGGIVNDGTIMKPHLYLDGKSEVKVAANRFNNGFLLSFSNLAYFSWLIPSVNSFGSNEGELTRASVSPVFG